jgi:hypothetical protein
LKHAPASPSLVSTLPEGQLVSTAPLAPCQHASPFGDLSARHLALPGGFSASLCADWLTSEGLLKARSVLKARVAGGLRSGSRRLERADKRSPKGEAC